MNEVDVLALHVGREVGECVEAPFDRAPVVAVSPISNEPLEVIYPDPRRRASSLRLRGVVISIDLGSDRGEPFVRDVDRVG